MRTVCEIPSVVSGPAVPCGGRRVPAIPREEFLLMRRVLKGIRGQLDVWERELDRFEQFQIEGPSRNS